jgi:hypothetical protein
MDKLSPGARATLQALADQPGNVHELAARTGRSRSGTDKALRELARAGLITKVDGGDPADGAPARWQHTNTATTTTTAEPDTTPAGTAAADPSPPSSDPAGDPDPAAANAEEDGDGTAADEGTPPDRTGGVEQADGSDTPGGTSDQPDPGGAESDAPEADEPKICRGCGEQLPRICPHCWQKTPSYCGTCRKNMPQVRRGEPGEPTILPSGLPRLRPGELEQLVLEVLRQQPLPNHVGITGWTAQRVAIYLPGRSTGAIGNALNKLTKTGQVELIGEQPMRYQLVTTDTGRHDTGRAGTQPPTGEAARPPAGTR